MCDFEDMEIVAKYTKQQAVDDGALVEVLRWQGRSVMATTHLYEELGVFDLVRVFREFRVWRDTEKPTLPSEEQLFSMSINGKTIWVIEDRDVDTIMYPEEY